MKNIYSKEEPRFTRGEYWLLETVVRASIPLCWLDWNDMEECLNKHGHGMSHKTLVNTLYTLFSHGLIEAYRFHDADSLCFLSLEQIEEALHGSQHSQCWYYGLTQEGGAVWEAFAAPKWRYYIDESYEYSDDTDDIRGEFIWADKEHLKQYLESVRVYSLEVMKDSLQWDELEPWQATYWKEVPHGYRVQCLCSEKQRQFALFPFQLFLIHNGMPGNNNMESL